MAGTDVMDLTGDSNDVRIASNRVVPEMFRLFI